MADQDREVVITIRAKNLTDAEAKAAAATVLGINTQIESASGAAQRGTQSFQRFAKEGLDKTGASATGLKGLFGELNGVLGMFGVGLSIGAVVGFGKALLDDADALVKLHDKTALSIGALQEMKRVGADTSVPLENLAASVSILQRNIANGDQGAVNALQKLGLRLEDIRRMSPEEQYFTIAKALRGVKDQTELVATGAALMGKGFTDTIPAIKQGFGEIDHRAEHATEVLDKLGDALGRAFAGAKGGASQSIAAMWDTVATSLQAAGNSAYFLSGGLIGSSEATEVLALAQERLKGILPNVAQGAKSLTISTTEQANIERVLAEQLREKTEAQKKATEADAKAKKVTDDLVKSTDDLEHSLGLMKRTLEGVPEAAGGLAHFQKGLIDFNEALSAKSLGGGLNSIVPGQFAKSMTDDLREGVTEVGHLSDMFVKLGQAAGGSLGTILGGLGQMTVLLDAANQSNKLTHGNLGIANDLFRKGSTSAEKWGSAVATAGVVASGAVELFHSKTVLGAVAAGAKAGAAFGPWGMAIGAGVGALVGGLKKLFGGASELEKATRAASDKFQDTIAAQLTGQQKLEAGGEKWKMTVIGVRDLYIATGKSADEGLAAAARLFDTKNPEAYKAAVKEVQDQLDLQKRSSEALDAAVQKYGFSIEQLGPKFRNQKLSEMAQELFSDYGLLTGSGIAVADVTDKMAAKVNEYIATVRRAGGEVPAEMQPMLQKFLDLGLITDESGNKVNSLKDAGVTFATTMSAGFKGIIDRLDQLLVGLGVKLPAAINAIPDGDFTITGHYVPPDNGPAIPDQGFEGHARGGVFAREHIARIAEGGRPEMVGSVDFMTRALVGALSQVRGGTSASAGQAAMGGGGDTVINLILDGQIIDQRIVKTGQRAFAGGRWQVPVSALQPRSA